MLKIVFNLQPKSISFIHLFHNNFINLNILNILNRKLMEKLPQRNLLLPNAPITPFSTTKKSKHPFKQLLSTSGKHTFIF